MPIIDPIEVKPHPPASLWLRYADGTEGVYDLQPLIERGGVMNRLAEPGVLERVHLGLSNEITFGEELDFCADAIYLEITGLTFEQLLAKAHRREAG